MTESHLKELARSSDVAIFAAPDEARWTIGNGLIEKSLVYSETDGLQTDVIRCGDQLAWSGRGEGEFGLRWNGVAIAPGDQGLLDVDVESDLSSATLIIRLQIGDALNVSVHLRCWTGLAVIEQWLVLEALQGGVTSDAKPLRFDLDLGETPVLQWISGVQRQGGFKPELGDYRSFRLDRQALGEATIESGLRSTWDESPWFALSAGSDGGIFAGLRYSGRWRADARCDGRVTTLDFAPVGIAKALEPGEIWQSPALFFGVFEGDLDEAAAVQHDYHRQVLSPPLPGDFPWVQYNTWFSYLTDFDESRLKKEVDIAAELGIEIFYVDAGWYLGNQANDWHFAGGLGNWRENRDKFPGGIKEFADYVRGKGLRFGIWVEPERVDLRTATTGSWHTSWLLRNDGRYSGPDFPQDTETAWLCYGDARAQDWAIGWISDLVESLGVEWLKWDSNYWDVCNDPDHGHGAGDGEEAQLAGVYRVWDELRERFPDLIIENCAGGGTRMDFEMAAHSHVAWVDDASEPTARNRFHLEGASYLFPPVALNSWVTESRQENLNGRNLPEPVTRGIVRSRMLGALGFSCRMVEWLPETKRVIAESIAEYKTFRHLLKDGYVSHLLPQATLINPLLLSPQVWEAIQFRSKDASEAVILAFRNISPDDSLVIYPKRIQPDAAYWVTDDDSFDQTTTGKDLMENGLRVAIAPLTSVLLKLQMV
jgi:alpha-galactosidase